jgi:hypothetical protein
MRVGSIPRHHVLPTCPGDTEPRPKNGVSRRFCYHEWRVDGELGGGSVGPLLLVGSSGIEVAEGDGGVFGPCERCRTAGCHNRKRLAKGSGAPPVATQHLPDAPAVAVAPVVGQPIRVLGPQGQIVVVPERLRLPEAPVLPAAPISRILAPYAPPASGLLMNYQFDLPLKYLL